MASGKQSPLSSQDAVVATGLAFAGMAILQSKLFPSLTQLSTGWLRTLLEFRVLEWWPALLILAGIWVWLKDRSEKRNRKNRESISEVGGHN